MKPFMFDLNRLSPALQDRIVEAIVNILDNEIIGINECIPLYSEGRTKRDMVAWRDAAEELQKQLKENCK